MVGQIWSNKTINYPGYFGRIMFQSSNINLLGVQGLKYEYTKIDRAKNLCQKKKPEGKGLIYPNVYSIDMHFGTSVRNSKGVKAWGYSEPLFVGDKFCDPYKYAIPVSENSRSSVPISTSMPANSEVEANAGDSSLLNISYKISFNLEPGAEFGGISIHLSHHQGLMHK